MPLLTALIKEAEQNLPAFFEPFEKEWPKGVSQEKVMTFLSESAYNPLKEISKESAQRLRQQNCKIIFSFKSDVCLEVHGIAKELQAGGIEAEGINNEKNFRMEWSTNAKRATIGVCAQVDRYEYQQSPYCKEEFRYLKGRADQGQILLLTVKAEMWEAMLPVEIALGIRALAWNIANKTMNMGEEAMPSVRNMGSAVGESEYRADPRAPSQDGFFSWLFSAGYSQMKTYNFVGNGVGTFNAQQAERSDPGKMVKQLCQGFLTLVGLAGALLAGYMLFLAPPGASNAVEAQSNVTAVGQVAGSAPYDCVAGYSNWKKAWSEPKQKFCCKEYGRGCGPSSTSSAASASSPSYDCKTGFENWSVQQQAWCCEYHKRGCLMDISQDMAAKAPTQAGDKAAKVRALQKDLKDSRWEVRMNAAKVLGNIGDKEAVPALQEALKDTADDVRYYAAIALGDIGDKDAAPALRQALQDNNSAVRNAAQEALDNVDPEWEKLELGYTAAPSDLRPLRPRRVPSIDVWLTAGAKMLMRGNGRYYHEVKLGLSFRDRTPQLGWLTDSFAEGDYDGNGVGDDRHGWAADGVRGLRWHDGRSSARWPRAWRGGDVIGFAVDIDAGQMRFSLNGEWVPEAEMTFDAMGHSLFPAVTMRGRYAMHIPKASWRFTPPDEHFQAWASSGVFTRPEQA